LHTESQSVFCVARKKVVLIQQNNFSDTTTTDLKYCLICTEVRRP